MCRSGCRSFLILDGRVLQSDVVVVVVVVVDDDVVVVFAQYACNPKTQDFCKSPGG